MTERVSVQVRRSGRRFDAEAVLELNADARTAWGTITDYDALPSFMPGIHDCRVIERQTLARRDEQLLVEQRGEFRFLLFAQSMKVMLNIENRDQRVTEAKALSFELGRLKRRAIERFEGRYELTPLASKRRAPRVRLRYTAVIGLVLPPPPAIGSLAVRRNLAAQLEAVAAEIVRRAARTS